MVVLGVLASVACLAFESCLAVVAFGSSVVVAVSFLVIVVQRLAFLALVVVHAFMVACYSWAACFLLHDVRARDGMACCDVVFLGLSSCFSHCC